MGIEKFETNLQKLKGIDKQISILEEQKNEIRKEIFAELEEQNLRNFKNEIATITVTERKVIEYTDRDKVVDNLKTLELDKYFETKVDITKQFEKDIKGGVISFEGVSIASKLIPVIKFNKE